MTRSGARTRTLIMVGVLFLAGMLTFAVRALWGTHPPDAGESLWRITVDLVLSPGALPTRVRVAPPHDTAHAHLVAQSLSLTGMRLRRLREARGDRNLLLVADLRGPHRASIHFDVRLHAAPWRHAAAASAERNRERYLQASAELPADAPEVRALAQTLAASRPGSVPLSDHLTEQVFTHVTAVADAPIDDAVEALREKRGTVLARARAAVSVLRASAVPARLVSGVVLEESRRDAQRLWIEAFEDGRWRTFDPQRGSPPAAPERYLPLNRNDARAVWADDAGRLVSSIGVERQHLPGARDSDRNATWLSYLDFATLPLAVRDTIGLILLLPLGALATVIARRVIGVRTYGIFTPVLLALAAQFVDAVTGITIGLVVTVLAMAGRALLPGLSLTRTPRLAIVFTLVALATAIGVSLLLHLGMPTDSLLVLLPMVVLTTLVDRVYAVADERGLAAALTRLGWTLGVGVVCYAMLQQGGLATLLVRHPELHLVTLGLILGAGAWPYRRASELSSMRWLVEPRRPRVVADDTG